MTTLAEKAAHVRAGGWAPNHLCHWPGCPLKVKPALWGCVTHWFMLPQAIRNKIWKAYRPGQETDKSASAEYLKVAQEAQAWIAAKSKGSSVAADADAQLGQRMSAQEHRRENS